MEAGALITDPDRALDRWTEYFEALLDVEGFETEEDPPPATLFPGFV